MSQEVEILKILADIAIIFMSITIPTYAIAISFLGKEHVRVLFRIKNEREKLENQLRSGKKAMPYVEIEKKVDEIRAREKRLKKELRPLSVLYVVLLPSLLFTLALLVTVVGILNYPQEFILQGAKVGYGSFGILLGVIFIIVGTIIFICILLKIEAIAKRAHNVAEENEGSV